MIISHIIFSIDKSSGGPSKSVTSLIEYILETSDFVKVNLHTLESLDPIVANFKHEAGTISFYKSNFLGKSESLMKGLEQSKAEIFHGHGLWQMPVHQMARYAQKKTIPYIISPRGMLDTWSVKHKGFKKKLALYVYQKRDIINANCLHATSKKEAENIRKLGFTNPIAVIPNGVNLPKLPVSNSSTSKKSLLFVARLVKNKGIEELLKASQLLDPELKRNWDLNIVGEGTKSYEAYLKNDIKHDGSIKFLGPLYGKQKQDLFNDADLFVLPTYTENFGIVIAEALASSTPVITTKGAPWKDLETHQAGWWIDIGVEPLVAALNEALGLSEEERVKMGKNGRKLVEEKYSIQAVALQMKELYSWILNGGDKPKFLY